ncbi:MAG: tetratricopeptide repeat protein [Acidobacteriota bacterium]|nr:MAG: tetratricopeptide repeat protein [Acidobacteriota bacterium]
MTNKVWGRFRGLVERIETLSWGPGTVALTTAAIIAVRHLLELIGPRNPVFPSLAAFVHYPLAYVGPFVALTLVLAFWSGVAPARVARLMVLAWTLTLIPPLADLLLHRSVEVPTVAYLRVDPQDLGWVYAHFFDPTKTLQGTTAGIRIEAALAVVLGAVYVLLHRRGVLRALGAAASIYVVSLAFFTLPMLVLSVMRLWRPRTTTTEFTSGEGMLIRVDRETSFDSLAVMWLVPLLVVLFFFWARVERDKPERWIAGRGGPAIVPGAGLYAGLMLLAGVLAARWLHLPSDAPLVVAPYDYLAIPGAAISITLLVEGVCRLSPRIEPVSVGLVVAGLAGFAALGRAPPLGAAAALAPLVPLALGVVGATLHKWAIPPLLGISSLGAFCAGYGLLVGPEAPGRVPWPLLLFALLIGSGTGVLLVRWRSLLRLVLAGLLWTLAAAGFGVWPLTVVAALLGAGLGVIAWGIESLSSRSRAASLLALIAGVLAVGLTYAATASETLGPELGEQARCVARLLRIRGEHYRDENNASLAINAFKQALRCDPDDVVSLRNLALLMRERGRDDDAYGFMSRAVELWPRSPIDLVNLAVFELDRANREQALALLDRAVAIDPRHLGALFNRARALDELGQTPARIEAWQRYLRLAEGRPEEDGFVRHARRRLRELRRSPDSPAPRTSRPATPPNASGLE